MKNRQILVLITTCLFLLMCGQDPGANDPQVPESLKIKAIGLPEGFVLKINAYFYPSKLNALCKNYWSIPTQGHAVPMNLKYRKELNAFHSETEIPLTNSKLPMSKRWPFCKWRLGGVNFDLYEGLNCCYSKSFYPKQDTIWEKTLGFLALPRDSSNYSLLPDTLFWGNSTGKCNFVPECRYFLFRNKYPFIVFVKCE